MIVRAVDVAAALSILAIFYSVGWIVRAARRARITLNIPEQIGPPPPPSSSSGPSSASAHETNVDNETFIKVLKLLKRILSKCNLDGSNDDDLFDNLISGSRLPNGQEYQLNEDQIKLIKETFFNQKIDIYIEFVKNFINADTTNSFEKNKYDKFLDMLKCSNDNTITKDELISTFISDNNANTRIDKNAMTEYLTSFTNNSLTKDDLITIIDSIIEFL